MNDQPQDPPPSSPPALQFDRAEYSAPGAVSCVGCKRPIHGVYYTVNKKIVCPQCYAAFTKSAAPGTRGTRFLRAFFFGLGGAVLGSILWFAIARITGYEIGIVAVAAGIFVGGAVRAGSNRMGGRGYQFLAIALTWLCIAGRYVPVMFNELNDHAEKKHAMHAATSPASTQSAIVAPAEDGAAGGPPASDQPPAEHGAIAKALHLKEMGVFGRILALLIALALILVLFAALPIVIAIAQPFEFLMIGLALWQAWKMNRRRMFNVTGPHTIVPA